MKLWAVAIGIAAPLFCQTFDVATIKPSTPDTRQGLSIEPGPRIVVSSFTLQALISLAWHVTPLQMSGGDAGWIATDRWNIEAVAEGVASIPRWVPPNIPEPIAARLRTLLEDRFALKAHRESRQQQVYTLTVAKTGSKLTQVEQNNPQIKQAPGSFRAGPGVFIGAAVTMNQIVTMLNRLMDRPLIDKTGLTGYFDINLQFAPESAPGANAPAADPQVSTAPSLFTAIQEQLGLKLESAREPTEVLVIDSASKPTQN